MATGGGGKLTEAYVDVVVRMGQLDAKLKEVNAKVAKTLKDREKVVQQSAAKETQIRTGEMLRQQSAEQRFQSKLTAIVQDAANKRARINSRAQSGSGGGGNTIDSATHAANMASKLAAASSANKRLAQDIGSTGNQAERAARRLATLGHETTKTSSRFGVMQNVLRIFGREAGSVGRTVQGLGQGMMSVGGGPGGRGLLALGTMAQGIGRAFTGMGASGTSAIALVVMAVVTLTVAFGALKLAIMSVVAGALMALGKAAVGVVMDFDTLMRGLDAVTGSARLSAQELDRLMQVALQPGITLQGAIKGAINLQSAGLAATDAENAIRQFGNALAFSGKSGVELPVVIQHFTKLVSTGKLYQRQITEISGHMPVFRKALKDAFGSVDPKVINKLGLSGVEMAQRITAALQSVQRVSGGMKNSVMNLSDYMQKVAIQTTPFFRGIVQGVSDYIAGGFVKIGEFLAKNKQSMERWGKEVLPALKNVIQGTIQFVAGLFGIVQRNGESTAQVVDRLVKRFVSWSTWWNTNGYKTGEGIRKTFAFLSGVAGALNVVLSSVVGILKLIGTTIYSLFKARSADDFQNIILGSWDKSVKGIGAKAVAMYNNFKTAFEKAGTPLRFNITPAKTDTSGRPVQPNDSMPDLPDVGGVGGGGKASKAVKETISDAQKAADELAQAQRELAATFDMDVGNVFAKKGGVLPGGTLSPASEGALGILASSKAVTDRLELAVKRHPRDKAALNALARHNIEIQRKMDLLLPTKASGRTERIGPVNVIDQIEAINKASSGPLESGQSRIVSTGVRSQLKRLMDRTVAYSADLSPKMKGERRLEATMKDAWYKAVGLDKGKELDTAKEATDIYKKAVEERLARTREIITAQYEAERKVREATFDQNAVKAGGDARSKKKKDADWASRETNLKGLKSLYDAQIAKLDKAGAALDKETSAYEKNTEAKNANIEALQAFAEAEMAARLERRQKIEDDIKSEIERRNAAIQFSNPTEMWGKLQIAGRQIQTPDVQALAFAKTSATELTTIRTQNSEQIRLLSGLLTKIDQRPLKTQMAVDLR